MAKMFEPKRELAREGDGWRLTITPDPVMTGIHVSSFIYLTDDQKRRYEKWREGCMVIQEAFPDLNDDQREIILSGIGPQDWDRLFPDEED